MQAGRIQEHDAVRRGRDDFGDPQLAQHPGHHLADRPGRVGQLLLRDAGGQSAGRLVLGGGKIEESRPA